MKKKIGLALGSGAARGFAHIGVLKVLQENNIKIDVISGTSIGALIGSFYAVHGDYKILENLALNTKLRHFFDFGLKKGGFFAGDKIENFIRKELNNKMFEDLNTKLFVSCFDIESGKEIIFNKGDIAKAVRASISIPGIFSPVVHNSGILVDGAILNPLPVKVLRETGCNVIIAVNLNPFNDEEFIFEKCFVDKKNHKKVSIINVLLKSYQFIEKERTRMILNNSCADVIINPDTNRVGSCEFKKVKEAISSGEEATLKEINNIKGIIGKSFFSSFGSFFKKIFVKS